MDELLVWLDPSFATQELLRSHPYLQYSGVENDCLCRIETASRTRRVYLNRPELEVSGLIEVMDNNPLVCADAVSIPGPFETLALIALLPLIHSSELLEPPALVSSFESSTDILNVFLEREGWNEGLLHRSEILDLGTVRAITVLAEVRGDLELDSLRSLFSEVYARSFTMIESTNEWSIESVADKPFAFYQLSLETGGDRGLAKIKVMADVNGKCGGSQLLHVLNIMFGFEETLGLMF